MLPTSVVERAISKSHIRCKLSQNSGLVPSARPIRNTVSAVSDQRRFTMSCTRTATHTSFRPQRGIPPHHSPSHTNTHAHTHICSNITTKRRSGHPSDQRHENEESPRRNGERAPPLSALTNTIEYCTGRGRVARSRQHTAPRRCPPKPLKDV